jgi:Family of unknown function (DUF6049)
VVVGAVLVIEMLATNGVAFAHTGSRAVASASGESATAPLTLISQTAWVAPGQNFDLKFRVGVDAVAADQLGVSVAVYPCLSSVSAFDQSVSTSSVPSGTPISSTPSPLPVSGLPAAGGGGVELSMPVVVGSEASPAGSAYTISLTTAGDQCGAYPSGVYPVRLQLTDLATKQTVAGVTTHLVYTDAGTGTQRLRVAVVLPLQTPLPPSRSPTQEQLLASPSAALDPPAAGAAAAVGGVVATLSTDTTVPMTLEVSPSTVSALSALNKPGHPSVVSGLTAMAADPMLQLLTTPFAPVDATSLVDTGLGTELALQVSRGAQSLAAAISHPPPTSGAAGLGAWIANDPLDPATATQLARDGYTQLVLPPDSVSSSPANGSTAEPFQVSTPRGPMTAVVSNADLSARFTGSPGNPVLAAHQLVSELAQIYFEKPNDTTPRAVVVVAPVDWSTDPLFVQALTEALDGNPIIQPLTTSQLFGTFDSSAAGRDGRLLPVTGNTGLPVSAIRAQRQRINGLSSATSGLSARALTTQLSDLVLAGESEVLRPSQQSGVLTNTDAAVDAQLAQLQVAGDRTVTLTSQQGILPVTIVSATSYPVSATLTLTSDKLLFPNGTTQWTQPVSLQLPNTVVDVRVRARASGVFKVGVVLHSPAYGLELSSGEVDVRSTTTSVVGVILSVGALCVLAFWWFRTSRKRRAARRAEALETGAQPGLR